MATFNLTDKFGLVLSASPTPFSIFAKYLKTPGAITSVLHDFKDIRDLQVGQDPFQSQSVGLSFNNAIDLGTGGVELTIEPELPPIRVLCRNGCDLYELPVVRTNGQDCACLTDLGGEFHRSW